MNEILKMLNGLSADDLDSLIVRANIMLEKKRKEEAEQALQEQERLRQEKLEQEKQRQQEIADLQRRLEELQRQSAPVPEKPTQTESFVAAPKKVPSFYTDPAPAAPAQPKPAAGPVCPSCRRTNSPDARFCENCGASLTQPVRQAQAAPAAPVRPASNASAVRYAPEGTKKWEKLPGENTLWNRVEITLLQPAPEKRTAYFMEVTDKRILLSRENAFSAGMHMAGAMGGGLVGGLIMDGIKAATGAGPKPWLEIPMSAISSCTVQNKKEVVIVAGETYVIKGSGVDKNLPAMVANVRR